MSKSATSDPAAASGMATTLWLLLQTLWVGGLWILHFMVLPGLSAAKLAPLLIEEVARALVPQMVIVTLVCVLLQAGLLAKVAGLSALWRERRGQLLLATLVVALGLLASLEGWPQALYLQRFSYLLLAFFGLLLVQQPVPVRKQP
ncbi:DUF4149 domain-containing protein [Pseudomonas dryadis]|uniref:DUF4149 domain-containing protein n=2 Tax=Pseudomonadales TaxID=72274 RepID=A0ABY1ZC21_9GAMM|nr:DUF4149 domain-containing protein [Pseudomonas dryadis]TBV17773.1 DUF4149 domain-containing protein [Pseudomonas sp. FRB 230]